MGEMRLATLTFALGLTGVPAVGFAQSPGQSSQPGGTSQTARAPIQTKTAAEYQAYQAAIANAQNPAAMEKAADEFAAKFPDSAVRVLLNGRARNPNKPPGMARR